MQSIFKIYFYWSIIALQCRVPFFCAMKWISSMHAYMYALPLEPPFPPQPPFHPCRSSQSPELNFLCSDMKLVASINLMWKILAKCFSLWVLYYQWVIKYSSSPPATYFTYGSVYIANPNLPIPPTLPPHPPPPCHRKRNSKIPVPVHFTLAAPQTSSARWSHLFLIYLNTRGDIFSFR